MLHIPPTNCLLLTAKQEPYKKAYLLTKNIEFSGKSSGEWTSRQKKRSQNTQEAERHFLMGRNRAKCANFQGSPLFWAMYNINTLYIAWKRGLPQKFACFLYVAWKRGLPQKCACFVLFCPTKKCSFNLLFVLDLFSERWQSTLFQIFLYFFPDNSYFTVCTKSSASLDTCKQV